MVSIGNRTYKYIYCMPNLRLLVGGNRDYVPDSLRNPGMALVVGIFGIFIVRYIRLYPRRANNIVKVD